MRILVVDLSGLFWSAWFASADQELSSARRHVVAGVRARSANYDRAVIAVDMPPYLRSEISRAYKTNRETRPRGAYEALGRCLDELTADGHVPLSARGYEADDIIASLCEWTVQREHTLHICTRDKDLLSCVRDPLVAILHPDTHEVLDEAAVRGKCGVAPALIEDWLALVGDKSDNVPGVPNVGPKRAAELLAECGSLAEVRRRLDAHEKITCAAPRVRECLELAEQAGTIHVAAQLVRLHRHLVTDGLIDPADIERQPVVRPVAKSEDDVPEENPMADPGETQETQQAQQQQGGPPPEGAGRPLPPVEPPPRRAEPQPTTAIVQQPVEWERQLEPRDLRQAKWLADQAVNSRLFSAYGSSEAALTSILTGRALGLDAFQSLRSIFVVKGRPVMAAQLLHALCLRHPACEYFALVESTNELATYETKRRGEPQPVSYSYTINDAERAGLTGKDNWRNYTRAMLRNRCVAELARAVYPDACTGLYVEEEAVEFEHAP